MEVRDRIPYFHKIRGKVDPVLSKKSPTQLMIHLNSELGAESPNPQVIEYCMQALASVTLVCMQNSQIEAQCQLLDNNVCDAIERVLSLFGDCNVEIARRGCEIVRNLAWGSSDFCEVMMEPKSNISEVLIYVCNNHLGDAELTAFGISAIAFLGNGNMDRGYRLAQAGALECICQLGNFGLNLRHMFAEEVSIATCYAIEELCMAGHAQKIVDSGVCDLIATYMRLYNGNPAVRGATLKALVGLSSLNFACRERLGMTIAPVLVCQNLFQDQNYPNKMPLIEKRDCCEIIMHLSLNVNLVEILVANNALQLVLSTLIVDLIEEEFGAEICCGAIHNMTQYGATAASCRRQLARALPDSGDSVLDKVRKNNNTSYRAREIAKSLLTLVAAERDQMRESLPPNVFMGIVNASETKNSIMPLLAELRIHTQGFSGKIGSDDDSTCGISSCAISSSEIGQVVSPTNSNSKRRLPHSKSQEFFVL